MANMDFRTRWVLITGASSGLGKEMAKQLAGRHKANLILVARREDRLIALKHELESAHGVSCRVVAADLSVPEDVDRVFHDSVRDIDVYAVILNAGVTYFGKYPDLDWKTFQTMLATNVTSLVRLVHLFVPYLSGKKQDGGIMLISSMAGFLPVPYQSAYAGTKAFVTNFGQSLHHELNHEKFSLTVFSPGGVHTEMNALSGLDAQFDDSFFMQAVEPCAAHGIQAMQTRAHLAVPGIMNRIQLFLSRLTPRYVMGFIAARIFRAGLR